MKKKVIAGIVLIVRADKAGVLRLPNAALRLRLAEAEGGSNLPQAGGRETRDLYKIYEVGDHAVHALDGVTVAIDQGTISLRRDRSGWINTG